MKVKILKSRPIARTIAMWYHDQIGNEFEVSEDPQFDDMFLTQREHKGEMINHHIYKDDCEIVSHG